MDEREIGRVVRSAAGSVYGVTSVVGPSWYHRLAARLGLGVPGVRVETTPGLRISVDLHVAPGVPATQVASNVADGVRYRVQRDVGRPIDELTIRIDGKPVALATGSLGPSGGR